MARVSLKEAYDNKDVVAQIYAIRDIAEGASDTADSAKTTADDAKTYVDTLGVQVEGAVQTANNASASAQTSAETVAGYDARLTEVEGDLNQAESDIDGLETGLNAVTLRVTTAEGQIVTIEGRVTAIEGNYLKKSGDPQTVVSRIDVPTTATGVRDSQIANGTRIQNDLDAYPGVIRIANDYVRTGILSGSTAGSSSASGARDVPARFNTKSSGFVRTAQQGVNRHYPIACLTDANGDTVLKLQVATTDSEIQVYLQAVAIDGTTQSTKMLGVFNRNSGVWS